MAYDGYGGGGDFDWGNLIGSFFGANAQVNKKGKIDWKQIERLMALDTQSNRTDRQGLFSGWEWSEDPETGRWTQTQTVKDGMQGSSDRLIDRANGLGMNPYTSPEQFSSMLDAKMANQMNQQGILSEQPDLRRLFGDYSATRTGRFPTGSFQNNQPPRQNQNPVAGGNGGNGGGGGVGGGEGAPYVGSGGGSWEDELANELWRAGQGGGGGKSQDEFDWDNGGNDWWQGDGRYDQNNSHIPYRDEYGGFGGDGKEAPSGMPDWMKKSLGYVYKGGKWLLDHGAASALGPYGVIAGKIGSKFLPDWNPEWGEKPDGYENGALNPDYDPDIGSGGGMMDPNGRGFIQPWGGGYGGNDYGGGSRGDHGFGFGGFGSGGVSGAGGWGGMNWGSGGNMGGGSGNREPFVMPGKVPDKG